MLVLSYGIVVELNVVAIKESRDWHIVPIEKFKKI